MIFYVCEAATGGPVSSRVEDSKSEVSRLNNQERQANDAQLHGLRIYES